MSEGNEAARLDGPVLDHYRHVCVLYHSTDKEFRLLSRFIAESFKKGDRAFDIIPGVADLIAYRARLNDVVPKHEATVGCTYDLAKFSASAVIDVLRSPLLWTVRRVVAGTPGEARVSPGHGLRRLRRCRQREG
jgi:hypothetical protein